MTESAPELIYTKVAPPIWLGNQIRRDTLLARLDGALDHRLTLIHAPAGYGKTSLLSQWRSRFEASDTQVAWLTLEADDADLGRLSQYITLAISGSQRAEGMPGEPEPASDIPPRAALSAIINSLGRDPRKLVLILDDFHCAENVTVSGFLKSLIKLAPQNSHFVVSTRDYPWLDQSILAAEDQLLEFTANDLKFSQSEAEAMLARPDGGALDQDDVQAIVDRTEGWPIALQLTRLSLKRGMDLRLLVQGFRGASPELARYLSEQVLMSLPEESQQIVIRTALLNRLTGDVVNLLCDRQDGWMMLERLEQQGVLLSPTSPDRSAYRYHQLFADHLRERLARSDLTLFRSLHRKVADWFVGEGDPAEALHHAIQANDDALIAHVLEEAGGWRLIPQGLQGIVERGLACLPAATVAARPRLALAQVYLQIKRGDLAAARADHDRFLADIAGADIAADLWTEIRVVGDTLADYENAPVSFDDLIAREALLRTLPTNDHLIVANISETLGAKYLEGGWLERALEPTLLARSHYQALGSLYSDLFTRFVEARIKRAQGRLKDSAAILEKARDLIHRSFGDRSDIAANCAAFEAELLYEQGHRAEASALLDWALPHMEQSDGWVDVYGAAYGTAMRLAAANGSIEEAQGIADRARRLAQRRRYRQLELLASLFELELAIQYDPDPDAARALADEIGLDILADDMPVESPRYRPVVTLAALCRAKLLLGDGAWPRALSELGALKRWASQHGAGRLLIEVNLLLAYGRRASGEPGPARAAFDEAIGQAMFQGIVRPFLDASRFVKPVLDDALGAGIREDRFRGQFLQSLAKGLASQPLATARQGPLNDAEAAILFHLSRGYSNKEIARLIGMSPDTVKYRLKSVFRKIGVSRRQDAVRVSHERGLILAAAEPVVPA